MVGPCTNGQRRHSEDQQLCHRNSPAYGCMKIEVVREAKPNTMRACFAKAGFTNEIIDEDPEYSDRKKVYSHAHYQIVAEIVTNCYS